ncbi:tetratricopeptide repeat protein [Nonomuraea sp. SBT364]|uniref:tetratricopeptide repeat protein n=1 Tax=Nonomuraea sp. SBT364 TaxID=1580530 RepID=UPI0012E28E45|nr:tetratricopeptide repeat protein [Nonomuraea sp. SBT364]
MSAAVTVLVPVLVAGAALTGGCGGSQDPAPSPRVSAKPAIKPIGELVPSTGGGDVPETTVAVCMECQKLLASGRYEVAAERMDRYANQRPAGAGVDSSTTAVALVCAGAAKASLGRYDDAIKSLAAADRLSADLPAETRPQLLELMYHAQLVSYTAVGEPGKAQETLTRLSELGQDPDRYLKEACATGDLPACTGEPVRPTGEEQPPSPPETTTDPGPTDPGPTDPGPTDPGPTDPGPTDPGPTDPGPGEVGPPEPAPEET